MEGPAFDLDEVFDADYLYFYEQVLPPERTAAEVETIVRLLGLAKGARVLDLACGHGRIANRLAALGCEVAGLDRSGLFLERARADAAAAGVSVDYVEGDMRALPWPDASFDRVVLWFTAFGYFSDDDNARVLAETRRVLRPGGALLVEMNNRDNLLRRFLPYVVMERDGAFMIDINSYDITTGRTENERIVIRDGRMRRMRFGVRLFSFPELRDWLVRAGFSTVEGYGPDGEPLTIESRRMIVVASA